MALATRYNANTPVSIGNTSTDLSQKDVLAIQPISQGSATADNYASVMQLTATPCATCSTASATATKTVTMQNFPSDYSPIVGSKIKVKFTNANTATTQMYLKVGTLAAKPCTCRGIAMGAGSVLAGSKLEFCYDGESWDCQWCEAISTMDTTSKAPVNSTALNGALANYNKTVLVGNSDKIYYYKLQNILNKATMLADSVGNCWIITGNSGGIIITKIVERNTTTEVFHYDTANKILYVKVQQAYGFYISSLSNLSILSATVTDDSTEFDNITNEIKETKSILDTDLTTALNNYVPTAREFYKAINTNSSIEIDVAQIVRITVTRNATNNCVIYVFDQSSTNRFNIIAGTEIDGITVSYADSKIIVSNATNYGFRCLIERFG